MSSPVCYNECIKSDLRILIKDYHRFKIHNPFFAGRFNCNRQDVFSVTKTRQLMLLGGIPPHRLPPPSLRSFRANAVASGADHRRCSLLHYPKDAVTRIWRQRRTGSTFSVFNWIPVRGRMGGMASDAKSKKNPAAVALGRLGGTAGRSGPGRMAHPSSHADPS